MGEIRYMMPELKGPFKKEKDFQAALNKSLKDKGSWVYKLPDTGYARKPYDCIIVLNGNGLTYHCELKLIDIHSININALEDIQHYNLRQISKITPEIARVIVWSNRHNDYKVMTYEDFMSRADEKGTVRLFL